MKNRKEYMKDSSRANNEIMRILDALMDADIDPAVKAKMQSWFVADLEDNQDKQDAFMKYADKIKPYLGQLTGDALLRYNKLAEKLGLEQMSVTEDVKPETPKRRLGYYWKVAAVLLPAALIAGTWLFFMDRGAGSPEMRMAMSDKVQSAFLPDSSFVILSPNSTIYYYEAEDASRKVDLSGEAMFKVRKDKGRSFTVSTTNLTVAVRGTDFVVSEFPGSQAGMVALYDGSVEVGTGGINTKLSRGEMLTYDLATRHIEVSIIPSAQMIEKGYKPRLKFSDATFGEVIAALEAYHGVKIEVAPGLNPDKGNLAGDIENNTLEGTLNTILRMWEPDTVFKKEGEKLIIYRK